jgi:hypothetical protein
MTSDDAQRLLLSRGTCRTFHRASRVEDRRVVQFAMHALRAIIGECFRLTNRGERCRCAVIGSRTAFWRSSTEWLGGCFTDTGNSQRCFRALTMLLSRLRCCSHLTASRVMPSMYSITRIATLWIRVIFENSGTSEAPREG